MALVTTGRASPTMRQFLLKSMGEQAIRRIQNALRQAFTTMRVYLTSLCMPLVEEILFRMNEIAVSVFWFRR
jgi:hypothetical protein